MARGGRHRGARGDARRRVRQAARGRRREPEDSIPEAHPTDQYCAHHLVPENLPCLFPITVACRMFRLSHLQPPPCEPPWLTAVAAYRELTLLPSSLSLSLLFIPSPSLLFSPSLSRVSERARARKGVR